jgi:23S rRNA (adenine2503-C2)-methyltransferase
MGMGEPLANLTAVRKALEILCHPAGLGLSPRRITLSTAGLLPEIDQLSTFTVRPLLAVSLNATTDELRQQLMPVSRRYSLDDLRKTLERYPVRARERITVEYILLRGVNDSVEDAQRLAHFVAGFAHHINLIVFNEFDGSGFSTPTERAIDAFARSILSTRPTVVTVRRSRGRDVQGACGNLVREGFVAH